MSDFRVFPEDRVGAVKDKPKRRRSAGPTRKGAGRPPPTKARRGKGRRRKPKRRTGLRVTWFLIKTGFTLAFLGAIALAGIIGYYAMQLPPPSELAIPKRPANVQIIAMDGTVLGNRGPTGGEAVRLFELPAYLPQAVMAIEDRRFYSHYGIDPIGLARAMLVNLRAGAVVQGGSTLTQQLAKNLFLEPERTIERKIQEVILAGWLEWTYDKDEILEMYLNRVYLGAGATGVEAAARRYYGKSAREINLAEAATIAGLLKAPSRFAPTRHPERAEARMRTVLAAMVETGAITEIDAKLAAINAAEVRGAPAGAAVHYAADWVMQETTRLIGEVQHDVIVETTINPRLQRLAEDALKGVLDEQGGERDASQGAIITVDTSGAVRALVGGRDYGKSQFNRAFKAKRQPGSAFKPFVYLAAMEYGLSPDTLRRDAQVRYGDWQPKNYDGKYRGPMPLAEGLARSINTIAVRLTDEVGPDRVIEAAHRMGIDAELKRNLSLALGTSEVSLYELTRAYVPFANGGYEVLPHVVTRIRSLDGRVLYDRQPQAVGRIIDEVTLGAMNYMMQMTVTDGTARRASLPGGRPAAGKTGTTQDFRDAWFIGYTADLVTGVWIGNDDRKPMKKVTGGNLPALVWNDFMARAHDGFPIAMLPGWYEPHGGTQLAIDDNLPWLEPGARDGYAPGSRSNDPAAIFVEQEPPRRQGGGGIGGFFRDLFGG